MKTFFYNTGNWSCLETTNIRVLLNFCFDLEREVSLSCPTRKLHIDSDLISKSQGVFFPLSSLMPPDINSFRCLLTPVLSIHYWIQKPMNLQKQPCYNGLHAGLTHGFLIIHARFKICLNSLLGKGPSKTVNGSLSLINGSYFLLHYYLNSKCWNACEMRCYIKMQEFLLFLLVHWTEICLLSTARSQTTRLPKLKQFKESFILAAGMLCHIQNFTSKTPFLDQMTFLKYLITFQDIFFLCALTEPFLTSSPFPTFYLGGNKILVHFIWKTYFQETDDISVD